ncbi:hypothetical protein [Streptomyces sp. NPDC001135]
MRVCCRAGSAGSTRVTVPRAAGTAQTVLGAAVVLAFRAAHADPNQRLLPAAAAHRVHA